MAQDLPRTAADDRADALAAARALEHQLPDLIAWLSRPGRTQPEAMWQAVRIGRTLADQTAQVIRHSARAAERANAAAPLRSVS